MSRRVVRHLTLVLVGSPKMEKYMSKTFFIELKVTYVKVDTSIQLE